jgi:hypothetical protein
MATDQPGDKQIAAGQCGCDPRDQSSGIAAEPHAVSQKGLRLRGFFLVAAIIDDNPNFRQSRPRQPRPSAPVEELRQAARR